MSWQGGQEIPELFHRRWRFGDIRTPRNGRQRPPAHVGDAKPTMVVQIRKGRFNRGYRAWEGDDVDAAIPNESKGRPWQAWWDAQGSWRELPSVLECGLEQSFDSAGVTVATITVENIGYTQQMGALGDVYHLVEQGYLAPFRGYRAPGRPSRDANLDNEWKEWLARSAQIRVWQGYGEPERDEDGDMPVDGGENGAWVFNGLIDDVDPESSPYRITITARAGKTLTDQRMFGWNISRSVNYDPVVFMDRLEADKVSWEGGDARASSERDGHPARFVTDREPSSTWLSRNRDSANDVEWVEIRLPAGHYEEILLDPAYEGMEVFIGVYVRSRRQTTVGPGNAPNEEEGSVGYSNPTVDGDEVSPGWLGSEDVPGQDWPYIRRVGRLNSKQSVIKLRRAIVTGDNTIVRVAFRRLKKVQDGYRAGVTRLHARKRRGTLTKRQREKGNIILVDDVADVVKVCLRWAGYDEWEVEQTGVRLKGRALFNRSSFLIDPINKAVEQTGYVFYVGDPSDGDSLGVPIFRRHGALNDPDDVRQLRDTELLTGIKVKVSEEPLAYIIRVRGKTAKPGPRSNQGIRLGGDKSNRIMAVYRPPWWETNRLAGVLKHVTHTRLELRSFEECMVACYLIAINEALQSVTGVVEAPGHPGFNLDDQLGIIDTGTGMNTRMWISNRASTFRTGENAAWTMSLGGSMIDTPDLAALVREVDTKMPDPRGVSNGR